MKRTQFIELLHTIGKTWVSFFSIVMFVTLGAGLYLGLHWAGMAVETAADSTYDAQSFHDFDISYPYGITTNDLVDIPAVDGVSTVEGGYTAYATFTQGGQGHIAHILSAGDSIDRADCRDGRMPAAADDIAVDSVFAQSSDVRVGDSITFDADSPDDGDGMRYLRGQTYTVSGIVTQPAYLIASSSARGMSNLTTGAADCFMILSPSAFDTSAYDHCYSNVYIRCDALDGLSTFSKQYSKEAADVKGALATLGQTDAKARYDALHDAAQTKIDEGQAQIDQATQRIADGEAQMADAQVQISEAEAQIANYESQAEEAESQLANARNTLDDYQAQADAADAQISDTINTAAAVLVAGGAPGTQDEVADKLWGILDEAAYSDESVESIARRYGIPEEYISQYAAQANERLDQYRDYLDKKQQLADGWDTYYSARATLDAKEAELADAKIQLQDAKDQLAQKQGDLAVAKTQLSDAKIQLQDAKDQLAQMVEYDWNISGRTTNTGVIGVQSYYDSTNQLRYSMALVFLIVGLLVCYTAVSRIVSEQVISIGTKKALGLRGREITLSYLVYSAIAVLIGLILSALLAVYAVEAILNQAAEVRFVLGAIPTYFSLGDVAFIGLIEMALICFATWLACRRMLHRQAVDLLKGEEPPKNKTRFFEKWKLWDRLPLYSQSIVNNFFNDKTRVIGTLIGVAGCTTLVVIAMTMYINIGRTFDTQFDKIYGYDAYVSLDTTDAMTPGSITSILDDAGTQSTPVLRKTLALDEPDGTTSAVTVLIPTDEEGFADLYHIHDVDKGGMGQVDDSGVWISQAYAVHQHAAVGDMVELRDVTGATHELPIAGIYEFHLNHHEMVISQGLYEREFGETVAPNTMLIALKGADEGQLKQQLEQVDGYFSYVNDYESNKAVFEQFQSFTRTVVYIYLGLSALMAVVVLMNLTVMFIEEKKRDLIVLMINGFSVSDAKRYIYRDSIVLTVIGVILGVLLGMLLGYLSLLSIEFDAGSYVHSPSLIACLVGVGVSFSFAFIINLIALRRIPRFALTDINKM